MPPPDDGNEYLPFIDMIALEKINNNTFRSKALAFSPGGSGRAYGGHVFCQAIWAAAHTVDSGFVIHVRISYPSCIPFNTLLLCVFLFAMGVVGF